MKRVIMPLACALRAKIFIKLSQTKRFGAASLVIRRKQAE
jgi:hypothetical protein